MLFFALLHLVIQTYAFSFETKYTSFPDPDSSAGDSVVKILIFKILDDPASVQQFHYPKCLRRFYQQVKFELIWIRPNKNIGKTIAAQRILDCAIQYGLNRADYHPGAVNLKILNGISDTIMKTTIRQKVWLDLLMSDAMLTFINNLHFGKFNPRYTHSLLDQGEIPGFSSEEVLKRAIGQEDFINTILQVQPEIAEYEFLQNYLQVKMKKAQTNCDEAPNRILRKVAINMERLRWAAIHESTYINVNIPSYTLKFYTPDTLYRFKVIVGKPANPTPVLRSTITYFETAPDWKVPKSIFIKEILPRALRHPDYLSSNHFTIYDQNGNFIPLTRQNLFAVRKNPYNYALRQSSGCDNALGLLVFRFANRFNIYLHDTPEQQLFNRERRALSHGCTRVEQAGRLASIMLNLDGQTQKQSLLESSISTYSRNIFRLRRPIPIVITYLTCEIVEGSLVEYDDIYNWDRPLEYALFNGKRQ